MKTPRHLLCLMMLLCGRNALAQCPELGWVEVDSGFTGSNIDCMVEFEEAGGRVIVVGGKFSTAGGSVPASNIAKWDGNNWLSFGTGANGRLYDLHVFDDGNGPALYVAGEFTSIDGVAANYIAKWDGESWSSLGTGLNNRVRTIVGHNSTAGSYLYVGGDFTSAGGVTASRIARWNGDSWSPLGMGFTDTVTALAIYDGGSGEQLIAGRATGIQAWDGTAWHILGGRFPAVAGMTVFDNGTGAELYVGVTFAFLSGNTYLAKWNGTTWSYVGEPVIYGGTLSSNVEAFAKYSTTEGPSLFVGHMYAVSDESKQIRGVGRWNGNSWSNLGVASKTLFVRSLLVSDITGEPILYAGGGDTKPIFAKWHHVEPFTNRNGNMLVDTCEISSGLTSDCNYNGIPDPIELPRHYSLDQLTNNIPVVWQSNGRDMLCINQFNAIENHEVITHIQFTTSPSSKDGCPVMVLLFSDPNGDGEPSDAIPIASATTQHVYSGWQPDSMFSSVAIPPTYVGPAGTSFFVGTLHFSGQGSIGFGCALGGADSSTSLGRSWVVLGPQNQPGGLNLNDLGTAFYYAAFSNNWTIRAAGADCNSNDVLDLCDIFESISNDVNANGIPDECEGPKLPCVGDLAPAGGDKVVGVPDLLAVIASWGVCQPAPVPCIADIIPVPNGDGIVGVPDLLAVIANWGPCE